MHTLYRAENLIDAQLVKDAVEARGIPAFIVGAALTGGIGELPTMGLVEVRVPDEAAVQANAILDDVLSWLREGSGESADQQPDGLGEWPLPAPT